MEIFSLISALETSYAKYFTEELGDKRFKHRQIIPLINSLSENPLFVVEKLGESAEKRKIFLIKYGNGSRNILIWSQMHGNEPTGTMALFDLFNFLERNSDQEYIKRWRSEFSFHFIPMLNPDGVELFQRRNALHIDINRDALALQTPEARILSDYRNKISPRWAFNLHDQDAHYSVGFSNKPACISLLAPSYNMAEDINDNRRDTMLLLGSAAKLISGFIPGMIGRYWSTYSARCFGDHFQSLGTNTLLIESGVYPYESNKETPRKMNFLLLLASFELLSQKYYQGESLQTYLDIPENKKNFYDLIIENVQIKIKGRIINCDLAINKDEKNIQSASDYIITSEIADMGDLSTEYAFARYNAQGMEVSPGLLLPEVYPSAQIDIPHFELSNFRKGYLYLPIKNHQANTKYPETKLIVVPEQFQAPQIIKPGISATFYLHKDGRTRVVVANGELMELN